MYSKNTLNIQFESNGLNLFGNCDMITAPNKKQNEKKTNKHNRQRGYKMEYTTVNIFVIIQKNIWLDNTTTIATTSICPTNDYPFAGIVSNTHWFVYQNWENSNKFSN